MSVESNKVTKTQSENLGKQVIAQSHLSITISDGSLKVKIAKVQVNKYSNLELEIDFKTIFLAVLSLWRLSLFIFW